MARLTLFLFILVVLVILVLSNLSPTIALTILGIRTLALPLGVWVVGAIGAGALTTLLLSLLFNLSRPSTGRYSSRANPRRVAGGSSRPWTAWTDRDPQPVGKPSGAAGSTHSRLDDDWEADRQGRDEWENWSDDRRTSTQTFESAPGEPVPRNPSFEPRTEIRDREDEDWANWEGYADEGDDREEFEARRDTDRRFDRRDTDRRDTDRRDTDFELTDRPDRPVRPTPPRTDFESPQTPETRRQEGSVYSYGYRRPSQPSPSPNEDWPDAVSDSDDRSYDSLDDDRDDSSREPFPDDRSPARRPAAKPDQVYDADYRVIVPPYRPDPESFSPAPEPDPASSFNAPDSLDFAEEEDDSIEEPVMPSIEAIYGLEDDDDDEDEVEIWDEDWGVEDNPN
ncbi:hypothetical protein [Egbenema bharatensis]|uniref:hypothetical protein n=1 Tax=Egbenema bharatensis TaxID=3463334 RepID=UPI003A89808E